MGRSLRLRSKAGGRKQHQAGTQNAGEIPAAAGAIQKAAEIRTAAVPAAAAQTAAGIPVIAQTAGAIPVAVQTPAAIPAAAQAVRAVTIPAAAAQQKAAAIWSFSRRLFTVRLAASHTRDRLQSAALL